MCDGRNAVIHMDVSFAEKVKLMQAARAFLMPSNCGESFGLVAVEAMACGTPVIALNDGAVPEIVKEGGVLCADMESMIEGVRMAERIKPRMCRKNTERFSRENMAKNYLRLYRDMLEGREW